VQAVQHRQKQLVQVDLIHNSLLLFLLVAAAVEILMSHPQLETVVQVVVAQGKAFLAEQETRLIVVHHKEIMVVLVPRRVRLIMEEEAVAVRVDLLPLQMVQQPPVEQGALEHPTLFQDLR
jgi:hypothetical protein